MKSQRAKPLGLIEGFFGPAWPEQDRLEFAPFLEQQGFDFYLYAPKADPSLRKRWREPWAPEDRTKLETYARHFRASRIRFGVGLSPFELHLHANSAALLREKVRQLDVDILGLFFDDMPVHDDLAKRQLDAIDVVKNATQAHIIFCPTFYSPDPILEKVFGKRPERYFEEIRQAPNDIDFAWTGPKVIPDEIPPAHLKETAGLLGRAPFLWDNLFANDGPKNCKFLKLRDPAGRSRAAFEQSNGWAWNPMNQAALSQLVLRASRHALEGLAPGEAFDRAVQESVPAPLAAFLRENRAAFLEEGLDRLGPERKARMIAELSGWQHAVSREIRAWLEGGYVVGAECLTD